jgi:hypothetical protein
MGFSVNEDGEDVVSFTPSCNVTKDGLCRFLIGIVGRGRGY